MNGSGNALDGLLGGLIGSLMGKSQNTPEPTRAPINYDRMQQIMNSGVLRRNPANGFPQTPAAPEPSPTPAPSQANPNPQDFQSQLLQFLDSLGYARKGFTQEGN